MKLNYNIRIQVKQMHLYRFQNIHLNINCNLVNRNNKQKNNWPVNCDYPSRLVVHSVSFNVKFLLFFLSIIYIMKMVLLSDARIQQRPRRDVALIHK